MRRNRRSNGVNAMTDEEYEIEVKCAYEFYVQSPDGQYDLFVAEILQMEYFRCTGEILNDEN